MVYLPATSSEALHLKAIEELRELDFQTFETFVIHRLAKELELNSNVFKKKCFSIHYTTEEESDKSYHYCVLTDDDDEINRRTGCFSFLRSSRLKSIKFVHERKNDFVLSFNFLRHLRALSEFILREDQLRMEGIFLKIGSKDMQQMIREKMQSSKFLDLDELGCSVHDCANVLKQCLHQMTEPIFLSVYYPAYERVAKMAQTFEHEHALRARAQSRTSNGSIIPPDSELLLREQKLVDSLQLITQLIPYRKREIFAYVLDILVGVYRYRAFNRMSASALGAIFTPLIISPRGLPRDVAFSVSRELSYLLTKMIRVGKEVFGAPLKLRLTVWKYVLHSKDLDNNRPSVSPVPYY